MATSKLLTLVGLGASATAAVAGPGATFTGGPSLPPAYNSTLFEGLTDNSANLYSTFDLECTKKIFNNLGNASIVNAQTSGEAEANEFQLSNPSTPTSGTVEGCLKLDFKHYAENNKGAVIDTIEMAVSKGDHGLILLNSITNMLKNGGFGFDYRVVFLKKEQDNWKIQGGIQWHDGMFTDAAIPQKMQWKLLGTPITEEIFWKNRICTFSKECEAKLQALSPTKKEALTYEWNTSGTKNIYQGLELENLNTSTGGYESDFWNGEETPLSESMSTISAQASAIFKDRWRKPRGMCCSPAVTTYDENGNQINNHPAITAWFKVFRDDKGEWKKKGS